MSRRPKYETFPSFIPDNKLYRWSSCISRGGYYFMLATEQRKPLITEETKKELNEKLRQEAINLELVDTTIKVYPTAFIVFTILRPKTHPQEFIKRMLNIADTFPIAWEHKYRFNSIADVGTKFIEGICLQLLKGE